MDTRKKISFAGCAAGLLALGLLVVLWWSRYQYDLWGRLSALACAALFALLALAGDLGCAGGPTAVGFLSGFFGDDLKLGLITGAAFPLLLVVCTLVYRRAVRKKAAETE